MTAYFVLLNLFASAVSLIGATTNSEDICLTPSCVQAAGHILNNLHPDYESIDPCESFDQYVCGGFPSRFPDKDTYNIKEMQTTNVFKLRTILETPYSKSNDSKSTADDEAAFNMLVTNYNSCMNETGVNASALGDIPEVIQQITKLFPVGENGHSTNETLTENDHDALAKVIAYLSKIGVPIFGEFWTVADNQFPDVMVPQFGMNSYQSPEHALPSKILVSELAALKEEELAEILELILPDTPAKNVSASTLAKGVFNLATAIATAETSFEGDSDPDSDPAKYLYETATVEEAVKKAPALVLDKVITELAPEGYQLDRMVFQYQEIYANVSIIVSKTPKSTLQALMMVMTYKSFSPYLAESIIPGADRWETCFTYIDESLPWIAGKFFVDETYSDEKHEAVKTMAEELRSAFGDRVKDKDWLSDETKKLVEEKVSEIIPKIGYPDHTPELANATGLLQYYSGINITSSLHKNVLSIRKWAVDRAWKALKNPTDRTIWPEFGAHPYDASARYGFNYNHILISAGITQPPAMYMGAPSYLMYGGIGLISGHEVTHGFDTLGRKWNNDRQYKAWWDDGSIDAFDNRTQCFVDQFSSIKAVDFRGDTISAKDGKLAHIDGKATIHENIADSGGLNTAWAAWKKHEEKEPSPLLPGLEKFTKEQLFFIAMGQMWCSRFSDEGMLEFLAKETHSPPFARILGTSSNSKPFKEAWKCKNKEPVCELW